MKNNASFAELKLFEFGSKKKLILILCTAILWLIALIAYIIPNFNHYFLASFNTLRTNPLFASLCYYYTYYMLYAIEISLPIIYLASFKVNKLKPYRTVLLLTVMTMAIGILLYDLLKYLINVPRPWVLYPDIISIYHPRGSSFPSGHAFEAFATTLPLIICFLTNDKYFKRNWKKTILAIILMTVAITLSSSRILAGVHYLSDVLFAIGLAIILMIILTLFLQFLLDKKKLNLQNEKWYALIFLIILFIEKIFL